MAEEKQQNTGRGLSNQGSVYSEESFFAWLFPRNIPHIKRGAKLSSDFVLSGTLVSDATPVTVAANVAGTTETDMKSFIIEPSAWYPGMTLRLTFKGHYASDGTRTVHLRVGDGLAPTTEFVDATSPASATTGSQYWGMEVLFICTVVGATAEVEAQSETIFHTTTSTSTHVSGINIATITFDATTRRTIALTADWSGSTAGNTITIRQFVVEIIR